MQWLADEIAYCANVHPGITAAEIESNIKAVTRAVRQHAQLDSLNAGLWLCEAAATEYAQPQAFQRLQNTLTESGLRAVTFNGFPQHNFHQVRYFSIFFLTVLQQNQLCLNHQKYQLLNHFHQSKT